LGVELAVLKIQLNLVQVIMIHMRGVGREDLVKQLVRKMAPPLVTLLSSPPEVQWVALRNINLLLQKRPELLSNEMRVFFCKYNDPLYVKIEKLEIMVRLANENNLDTLLSELKECVTRAPPLATRCLYHFPGFQVCFGS
jgi:vesicle coat complex subunit